MSIKFVTKEAAVLLPGKTLIVADLHIGYEYEMRRSGIRIPSQTENLLERIKRMILKTGAKKLIILGDVKHSVPGLSLQEEREVPRFLNMLNDEIDLEIAPGNHDSGLGKLVPDIKFHPASGVLMKDVYMLHGHTWPETGFLRAGHILMGHNHPVIEFRDRLGYVWREQIWVKAGLKKSMIEKRYGKVKSLPELTVMPSCNYSGGGRPLNSPGETPKLMGPLGRSAITSRAKIYMLDGTYLGELGKIKG